MIGMEMFVKDTGKSGEFEDLKIFVKDTEQSGEFEDSRRNYYKRKRKIRRI